MKHELKRYDAVFRQQFMRLPSRLEKDRMPRPSFSFFIQVQRVLLATIVSLLRVLPSPVRRGGSVDIAVSDIVALCGVAWRGLARDDGCP